MKKKILVTLCSIALCSNLSAQRLRECPAPKNYTEYSHAIDSLVKLYSIKETAYIGTECFFTHQDEQLNDREKKKLLELIKKKMFEQNEYPNLHLVGHALLYNLYYVQNSYQKNSPAIRQLLMDAYLQYYSRMGYWEMFVDGDTYYSSIGDVSNKSKKRIVELLEKKKTQADYGWTEEDFAYFIRMLGTFNMKECIPALKQGYLNCENVAMKRAYSYALVRLGDEEQRQYFLDNSMNADEFDREDFRYFQDDEIVWKYIDVNFLGKSKYCIKRFLVSMKVITIGNIYPYLKKLPPEPQEGYYLSLEHWADTVYNWLLANKSTVQFDYEGEKRWMW